MPGLWICAGVVYLIVLVVGWSLCTISGRQARCEEERAARMNGLEGGEK